RDRGALRPQVQPARADDQPLPRLAFHLVPGGERLVGQADVSRRVVRETDDARMVLGRPVRVTDLEPLQAQDPAAQPAGEPVRSAAPDPAQPDHDGLVVARRHAVAPSPSWPWYSNADMAFPVGLRHARSSAGALPSAFAIARTCAATDPQHEPM